MNKKISIIGKGGHSKVVANIICGSDNVVSKYYDDGDEECDNIDLVGDGELCICAIGDNDVRRRVVERVGDGVKWANAVHGGAIVADDLVMGVGNVICPGVVVQPSVVVGDHCIINTSSSIDHDCVIGDYVHICPGVVLCGTVVVGEGSFIGAGSTVINNVVIGKGCIIGAGSNVVYDMADGVKAYGNPCRVVN